MSSEQGKNKGEMPISEVVRLADLVQYQDGSVVSRTIVKRASGTVTLFAFDEGQGLSEHTAAFDALASTPGGRSRIRSIGQGAADDGRRGGSTPCKPTSLSESTKSIQDAADDDPVVRRRMKGIHW